MDGTAMAAQRADVLTRLKKHASMWTKRKRAVMDAVNDVSSSSSGGGNNSSSSSSSSSNGGGGDKSIGQ